MTNYVVCLGTKGDKTSIRCIQYAGIDFSTRWGKGPKWKPYNSSSVEIAYGDNNAERSNNRVIIPNNKTKITAFQCWGNNPQILTPKQFMDLLKELSQML